MADSKEQHSEPVSETSSVSTWPLLERIEMLERRFGVEERGIERVPNNERVAPTPDLMAQVALIWCSMNLMANSILLGMLGPHVFGLSFRDSALLCFFGNLIGCVGPGYFAGLGAASGNRTLVCMHADSSPISANSGATR